MSFEIDTTPSDEVGDQYLRECIQTAKDCPDIEPGMLVMVFTESGSFVGHGQIIHTEWSDLDCQYIADVLMVDGGSLEDGVLACNMRRVAYDGSTQYALLKARTIKGGQA